MGSITFNNVSGFDFDIKKFVEEKRKADADYTVAGNYVVTYTATDANNNRSTKTYTIAISETFEDSSKVTVKFDEVLDYIVVDKTAEFTVPTPTYTSTTDNKLTLDYTINSGANSFAVKGGEEAKIVAENSKYVLYVDEVKAFEVTDADNLVLKANAKSDAGNELATAVEETIDVIVPSATALFSGVNFTGITAGQTFTAQQSYVLGNAVVTLTSADVRDQVGIEIGVRTSEGKYLTDVSAEIYASKNMTALVARNITVETSASGEFFLEIVVFDISGNRTIKVMPFVIQERTGGSVEELSTSVTASEVNEKFVLNRASIDMDLITHALSNPLATDYVAVLVREINGGRFSLMGDEFTALSTGNYSIKNKADLVKEASVAERYEETAELNEALKQALNAKAQIVTVSDTSAVQFELQGVLPTYANGVDVTLPKAVAYSKNANADEIEVEVKLNGEEVVLATDAQGNKTFKAEANGTYTVIYTVKTAGEASTFEYSIKSGDVIMPNFILKKGDSEASHAVSVKAGYEFEFLKVEATDDKSTATNLTYKKTVIGPDGETYGGTINAKGLTSGANKTIPSSGKFTLDEAGKYTVRYEVIDEAGNSAVKEFEITVTGKSSGSGISLAALSTILIIVGVLLIAGVVVYLFRFRKVKKTDKK